MNQKYDVVIIGSGLGGLVSAIILAKEGYRVCVLEKNQQFGGNLQTFSRDKVIFDTGVHYLGALSEGQNLNRYFKYLGILEDLHLSPMDKDGYDIITFENDSREYSHAQGYETFAKLLIQQFPEEESAVMAYCTKIRETCNKFPLYSVRNEAPPYDDPLLFREKIKDFLESITQDKVLRAVLAGSGLIYASDGEKTPLYMHALSVNSYIESSYRCIRGGSQITKALLKRFRELGGTALKKQEINKINFQDDKVVSVVSDDGKEFKAAIFISNIDPKKTLSMIDQGVFRKSYRTRINNIENTVAAFSLYLVLKPEMIPYLNKNYYHYNDYDSVWNALDYTQEDWPRAFMLSMGISEEGQTFADTISVLTYMHFDEVEQWADSVNTVAKKGVRSTGYEEFKRKKSEILIDQIEKKIPNIRKAILAFYASTPLSYRDYIGNPRGSMYGYVKDAANPMASFVSPKTRVENLFFTGQSLNMHGILGVTIGGIITCSEIIGRDYLVEKIIEETAK